MFTPRVCVCLYVAQGARDVFEKLVRVPICHEERCSIRSAGIYSNIVGDRARVYGKMFLCDC